MISCPRPVSRAVDDLAHLQLLTIKPWLVGAPEESCIRSVNAVQIRPAVCFATPILCHFKVKARIKTGHYTPAPAQCFFRACQGWCWKERHHTIIVLGAWFDLVGCIYADDADAAEDPLQEQLQEAVNWMSPKDFGKLGYKLALDQEQVTFMLGMPVEAQVWLRMP